MVFKAQEQCFRIFIRHAFRIGLPADFGNRLIFLGDARKLGGMLEAFQDDGADQRHQENGRFTPEQGALIQKALESAMDEAFDEKKTFSLKRPPNHLGS